MQVVVVVVECPCNNTNHQPLTTNLQFKVLIDAVNVESEHLACKWSWLWSSATCNNTNHQPLTTNLQLKVLIDAVNVESEHLACKWSWLWSSATCNNTNHQLAV